MDSAEHGANCSDHQHHRVCPQVARGSSKVRDKALVSFWNGNANISSALLQAVKMQAALQAARRQGRRGGRPRRSKRSRYGQNSSKKYYNMEFTPQKNPRNISGLSSFHFQGAPPGYIQGLINKVISNIQIVCNNLILKYVEEDLVLSLNVRTASLSSCDDAWNPAFSELSLPHLVLRKLLQV